MTQAMAAYPQAFPLIADLYAAQLDVQFMPQMTERLKNLVPPQILAKEEGKQLPPQPPSPQEQMMQQEQMMKQQEMKNKMADVQIKAQKLELDKQQAQIDQARLLLDAQKMQQDNQVNLYDHA